MYKPKTIHVTAERIAQARRGDSSHCMIADALKAAIPDALDVTVDLMGIRYTDRTRGERRFYHMPVRGQHMLLRFDQGLDVEPWSFNLPSKPAQTTKVKSQAGRQNSAERPVSHGPKRLVGGGKNPKSPPTVSGGKLPPIGTLSNSRGRRRFFGVRAAGAFDPSA